METQKKTTKQKVITFRKFLKKSTKLLTVFGILNGLAIYSSKISSYQHIESILSLAFWIMSIVVWWEIISLAIKMHTFEDKLESAKYLIFIICICIVQIYFVRILYLKESDLSALAIVNTTYMLLFGATAYCLGYVYKQHFKDVTNTKTKVIINIAVFVLIMELILAYSFLTSPILKILLEE